jgi:hypothetical protein
LLAAIADLKPVVFLDTAIRFIAGQGLEENSSSDMSLLVESMFNLLRLGAKSVVAVHHSPKAKDSEARNLGNTLRGSGDLGACADAVYSVRCTDTDLFRVTVANVKMREAEPLRPFVLQGRPYLSDNGGFAVVTGETTLEASKVKKLVGFVQMNPNATYEELGRATGISKGYIRKIADKAGWVKQGELWVEK